MVLQDRRAKGREELAPQRYVSTVHGCYHHAVRSYLPSGCALTFRALLPFFQKPLGSAHSEFSTGHAASPCTIVIGKAHIEKVSVPARPYRMLNNFVINKKIDFNEDLSGKIIGMSLLTTALSSGRMWMGVCLQRGGRDTKQTSQLLGVRMVQDGKAASGNRDGPWHFGDHVSCVRQASKVDAHLYLRAARVCVKLEAALREEGWLALIFAPFLQSWSNWCEHCLASRVPFFHLA